MFCKSVVFAGCIYGVIYRACDLHFFCGRRKIEPIRTQCKLRCPRSAVLGLKTEPYFIRNFAERVSVGFKRAGAFQQSIVAVLKGAPRTD